MKRRFFCFLGVVLVAAGCTRVTVRRSEPPPVRTGPIGVAVPVTPGQPGGVPPQEAFSGTTRPVLRFGEVRGLRVVRFSLATPASVQAVVDRASRAGFNTLVVQVRGRGDSFYASALEPRGGALAAQPAAYDPLQEIMRVS